VAVNRTELAEAVAAETGLDKKHAEAAVEAVTASIIAEVRAGSRVSIFGFGTFDPKSRAARIARNPQTQATVRVPASKTVGFKPASAFKDALNRGGKASPAKKAAPARKAAAAKKGSAKKAAAKTPAKATKATKKR
jgi:DNA-binding protein HU-beta